MGFPIPDGLYGVLVRVGDMGHSSVTLGACKVKVIIW